MRTYTINNVIQLPLLSASGALALGEQLVTAAKSVPDLPATLSKAFGGFVITVDILRRANADRLPILQEEDPKRAPTVDRWVDAAVSSMFDWLTGWARLPNEPQAPVARSLLVELFPKGLKFLRLNYKLEWAEIEARLVRIEARGLDAKIRQLGGEAFLNQLRLAHKEYGEVLGITQPVTAEEPFAGVREAYDTFLLALRTYVLKVAAYVEPDEPQTEELAAILLAPLHAWQVGAVGSARNASSEEATPEPVPATTTEPTPS